MEWQIENKYRRLEDVSQEEMDALVSKVNSCSWRQTYHIQPISGLLNDPNGFSFYNGEYHLFYQWHPLGPFHGLKYWFHTKSKDLVHWENVGIGLRPDSYFDSHGAYSGSSIKHNGQLYLFYTGNSRDEHLVRHPYQCIAIMNEYGEIKKLEHPVIDKVPEGYTEHYRDPKVWKEGERFYAVIGAQRTDETGCSVLYSSPDLLNWNFEGEIKTGLREFGYMWECPDYIEIGEQGLFIFSPQGIEPEGEDRYRNIYQSGYVLGEKLNLDNKELMHGEFVELDRGFDFYAPQTMKDAKGRRLLVGWMGLPDIDYPSDQSGWSHCLTVPRELSIVHNKLVQRPVPELQLLRKTESQAADTVVDETKAFEGFSGTVYELICDFENVDASEFGIEFRAGEMEKTVIKYDTIQRKVILDRSRSGEKVAEDYGTERKCEMDSENIQFHLFVDSSSVEIFVNDGEEVFTSRIFPDISSREIRFFAKGGHAGFKAVKWDY
ncbi:glycoside hydrolase family 32 protein [Paenibacillus sp. UASWS1643]|uniref:glycoside hydrolase family 32 protein n=1 Tax=Paenibacillus sp. UASWS1643 TaxID=2580422 RepID=UPI00123BE2D1|nr:sucrose-6-phosphate hydrolase [Paenibacillus sp. UASWS1643]KAA8745363.1 sucrose-6-phosphate hydrolase [Paenibacillus sp. UASWS1643]